MVEQDGGWFEVRGSMFEDIGTSNAEPRTSDRASRAMA